MMSFDKLLDYTPKVVAEVVKQHPTPAVISMEGFVFKQLPQTCKALATKNIHLIAAPNSGKTYMIKSILLALKELNPLVVLLAPTNTLGEGFLHPLAHFDCTGKFNACMSSVIKFQNARVSEYKEGNSYTVIIGLLNKLNIQDTAFNRLLQETHESAKKNNIPVEEYETKIIEIIKNYVKKLPPAFIKKNITAAEYAHIKYWYYKPHLVLILDDVGTAMTHSSDLHSLSTNYRHIFVTVIISYHFPTMMKPVGLTCASYIMVKNHNILHHLLEKAPLLSPQKDMLLALMSDLFKNPDHWYFGVINQDQHICLDYMQFAIAQWVTTMPFYNVNKTVREQYLEHKPMNERLPLIHLYLLKKYIYVN